MPKLDTFRSSLLAAGAICAVFAGSTAARAADIVKFADFSQVGTGSDVRWVKTGSSGLLFSIPTSGAAIMGPAKVIFNFDLPSLSGLSNLSANYSLNVTVPTGNPALAVGGFRDQPGLQGGFSFIYTGPTTVLNGHAITTGANLLTATLTDGDITGVVNGSAGSMFASTDSGSAVTYTSDFIDFTSSTSRDLSFSLNAVSPRFGASAGQALNSFAAAETGEFGFAIPEPATWTMGILGFGLLGATLRRRKAAPAFARI